MARLIENLETFLRGMETSVPAARLRRDEALKPSLEGWKRGAAKQLQRALCTLKPSLEGWKREGPEGPEGPPLP